MARTYQSNINPFQDFLLASMMQGADLSDKENETDIYVALVTILEYIESNKNDTQYLDFEIKEKDGYYKIVANNAISALWLSGIFPKSPRIVMNNNEYIVDNIKYKFNPRTKKLIHQFIKK
jgi:hypothetical protein